MLATASSAESTSASSPSAVVISPGDGQILLITDSVLSFLVRSPPALSPTQVYSPYDTLQTSSQGIQVDSDALETVNNNNSSGKGKGREDSAMFLFNTSLAIQRKELYKWSEHTPGSHFSFVLLIPDSLLMTRRLDADVVRIPLTEVRTATTPQADTNWRAAVWSPPNLSVLGGYDCRSLRVILDSYRLSTDHFSLHSPRTAMLQSTKLARILIVVNGSRSVISPSLLRIILRSFD